MLDRLGELLVPDQAVNRLRELALCHFALLPVERHAVNVFMLSKAISTVENPNWLDKQLFRGWKSRAS